MGSDGISKRLVAGHPRRIECREVQLDESSALPLVGEGYVNKSRYSDVIKQVSSVPDEHA
jgi:hypothetical protein